MTKTKDDMKEVIQDSTELLERVVTTMDEGRDEKFAEMIGQLVNDNLEVDFKQEPEIGDAEMVEKAENQGFTNLFEKPAGCLYQVRFGKVYLYREGSWSEVTDAGTCSARVIGVPGSDDCLIFSDGSLKLYNNGNLIDKEPFDPRQKFGLCAGDMLENSYFFVFGGQRLLEETALKTVLMFSLKEDKWQSMAELTTPRANASGCVLGGHLYVFGGSVGTEYLNSIERGGLLTPSAFATIPLTLPIGLTDIGIVPLPDPTSVILLGGLSKNVE